MTQGKGKKATAQPISNQQPRGGRGIKSSDPRKVVATGIKQSEFDALLAIAQENEVAVNSVIAFFLRDSLQRYQSGKLKIPMVATVTRKIQMP
jgi:hypothetical protein